MLRFIGRRLLWTIVVLLGVSVVVFFAIRLTPGDPALLLLGPQATPANLAKVRAQLGLDKPLVVQYAVWLGNVLQGDLGRSITYKQEVLPLTLLKLKASTLLGFAALLISVPVGLVLGVASAAWHNSWVDRVTMFLALAGISVPVFWTGLVLVLGFSLKWPLFPASGMYSPSPGGFADLLRHLVLPALTLAIVPACVLARMTRSSMLEVIGQDYVRTARAKGARGQRVLWRHAFRNALIPVVTVLGLEVGYVIGGAVVVETIFAWPGMGDALMRAVLTRDFPLVLGGSLIMACIFVFSNLVVDSLYAFLNPKIRYG